MKQINTKYIFVVIMSFLIIGLIVVSLIGKKQDQVLLFDDKQYHIANQLIEKGSYGEAIKILEELAIKYPDRSIIYVNLGLSYYYMSDFNKASINFKKSLELRPSYLEDTNFIFLMGQALYQNKEYDLAKELLIRIERDEKFSTDVKKLLESLN